MGGTDRDVGAGVLAIVASSASGGPAIRFVAAVELRPDGGSAARGAAYFTQRGARLSGWVVVWGLPPRSSHAVHFHGPAGKLCVEAGEAAAGRAP